MAGTLDRNLQILDQAIAESSDALQKEPQNVAARNSLFEALQRKISLLQDTITLMNEMRKGNAAGVAQVVEGHEQIMMRRLLIVAHTCGRCGRGAAGRFGRIGRRIAGAQTERLTRTVSIGATGELELSNIAGDIVVTRGSGAAATIEVVKTARGASVEEARAALALVRVEITERGTRAEARTHYPSEQERRPSNRRNFNVSVAYTVAAPEGTRIIAKSISGDISVREIIGALTLETVSGNVNISSAGRMASGRSIRATSSSSTRKSRARSKRARSAARSGFAG